jgi:DNA primase
LTADHLRSVHRLAEELILSFDSDAAGSDAAERAIDLAEANDFSVKVATFKTFKDAADAALADPSNVPKAIASAIPAPVFYFEKYIPKDPAAFGTREGIRNLRIVLAKLKHLASPVERGNWMKELAKRTGIAERTLEEEASKAPEGMPVAPGARNNDEAPPKRVVPRDERVAEELISIALAKNDFEMLDDAVPFFKPTQKEIMRIVKSGKKTSEDPALDAILNLVVLKASEDVPEETIGMLKAELAKEYYKERRKVIAQAVKNAEARGNDTELKAALEEMKNLANLE